MRQFWHFVAGSDESECNHVPNNPTVLAVLQFRKSLSSQPFQTSDAVSRCLYFTENGLSVLCCACWSYCMLLQMAFLKFLEAECHFISKCMPTFLTVLSAPEGSLQHVRHPVFRTSLQPWRVFICSVNSRPLTVRPQIYFCTGHSSISKRPYWQARKYRDCWHRHLFEQRNQDMT